MVSRAHWSEIAGAFLKLGLTSFGGPVAHLGYFREEFVRRRRWVTEEAYADLVALAQFLPGPASSQVVFALGLQRGGFVGALLASLSFTLPSAGLMIALAYGVAGGGAWTDAGWVHGLKLAAVAVVAQAVWGMGRSLCPDWPRRSLALGAAVVMTLGSGSLLSMAVILVGALIGGWRYRDARPVSAEVGTGLARGHGWAAAALGVFFALLGLLPILAAATDLREVRVIDGFYRAGSLVFGGGHVVLPLLRAEVVPSGWITDSAFLAGYGAAQALPGPLFTFSAYLGTIISTESPAWTGGLLALGAIFLPAWLLIGGTLPFWELLRQRPWAQAGLRGANAAVVGLLLAALYDPVGREGIVDAGDLMATVVALALLERFRIPSWAVVGLLAAAGQWFL